jgi:hypothetical protein
MSVYQISSHVFRSLSESELIRPHEQASCNPSCGYCTQAEGEAEVDCLDCIAAVDPSFGGGGQAILDSEFE